MPRGDGCCSLGVGDSMRKEVVTCKARVLLFPLYELAEHHSHVMYPPLLLRTFSLLSALPILHSFSSRARERSNSSYEQRFFLPDNGKEIVYLP